MVTATGLLPERANDAQPKCKGDSAMLAGSSPLLEKAHDVKEDLSELGSLAIDAALEKAGQVKDGAVDLYNRGCEQAKSAQTQAETYIRKEPLKALMFAGIAGIAIGWLLSRR